MLLPRKCATQTCRITPQHLLPFRTPRGKYGVIKEPGSSAGAFSRVGLIITTEAWIGHFLTNDGLLPNRSDEGAEPRAKFMWPTN